MFTMTGYPMLIVLSMLSILVYEFVQWIVSKVRFNGTIYEESELDEERPFMSLHAEKIVNQIKKDADKIEEIDVEDDFEKGKKTITVVLSKRD